ncbi:MAG: hypothetical protein K2Q33_06310 [Gammaproteobacteria bacterium]|nr:hypothetical protein [Gammaproteobacteria bacterium]
MVVPDTTIAAIEQYLLKCKIKLNELEFEELIHFALEETKIVLLRLETKQYLNGGVMHTVEGDKFIQLKDMLQRQLNPAELSAMGEKLPVNLNPAELPLNEASIVSLGAGIVPSFVSGAGWLYAINYFSKPPVAIANRLLMVISSIYGARLTLKESDYYTDWWLTRIVYDIQEYELLGFFNPVERNTILQGILSTPDFTVDADASKKKLAITIKPKHWRPNWHVYFDHLHDVAQLRFTGEQPPILKNSLMNKIGALLQRHLESLKFEGPVEIGMASVDYLTVKLGLLGVPSVYMDLPDIFERNGIDTVDLSIENDRINLEWLIPFSVLDLEGDFINYFIQYLKKINKELAYYISERIKYKKNVDCIARSLCAFHSGNNEISFNMGAEEFSWELKSGQNHKIHDIEITINSSMHLLQYVLYALYEIKSTINGNKVSHGFQREAVSYKREEADLLMKNVLTKFTALRARYQPAVCELVFINGAIKMQMSLSTVETMGFLQLAQAELSENKISAQLKKQHKQPQLLVDLSSQEMSKFGFSKSFAEYMADKKSEIAQKEAEIKEEEERSNRQKKIDVVSRNLNRRLNGFMSDHKPKWGLINGSETTLGLELREENYCISVGAKTILMSRNGLMAFIQRDLQKNAAVKRESIVRRETKSLPKKYRLVLQTPWLASINNNSMEHDNLEFLEKLLQLTSLYSPMQITLDYIAPKFNVHLELNTENLYAIQPYGLSDQGFIECVQKSLEAAIKVEGGVLRTDAGIIIPLQQLNSVTLPSEQEFSAMKEKQFTIEAPLSEESKEVEDPKDSILTPAQPGKKTKNKTRKPMTQPIVKTTPTRANNHQQFLRPLIPRFNAQESNKKIEALFVLIKDDLTALNFLKNRDVGMQRMGRELILYIHLSNLLEELVECARQFNKLRVIRPDWFNIKDPDSLSPLRIQVIKNINNANHTTFCQFVAEQLLFRMNMAKPFLIDIEDITIQGLKTAAIKRSEENSHLGTEKDMVDYDEIKAHAMTLKNCFKWGGDDLMRWTQENMDLVRALVTRTIELFNKKNESSIENAKYNLGNLYFILNGKGKKARNTAIHDYAPVPIPSSIHELMRLMESLNTWSIETPIPVNNSSSLFGASGSRQRMASSSHSSTSNAHSSNSNSSRHYYGAGGSG